MKIPAFALTAMAPSWTVLAALLVGGILHLANAECPDKYLSISTQHTMCLTDKGKEVQITDDMKKAVVARHNQIRSEVKPPPADMQKMEWSDPLAEVAAKWARQCSFKHDYGNLRVVPELPGVSVGQNIAMAFWEFSKYNLINATNAWAEEVENFTYGVVRKERNGHYIQQIWNDTSLIGCGAADCSAVDSGWYKTYIVCDYAVWVTETDIRTEADAYREGEPCSACPDFCDGNLCACGGLVCQNGGTPDVSSCSCQCTSVYKGTSCETRDCSGATEPTWCAGALEKYPNVCKYNLWFIEKCPATCAGCP